MIDLHTHSTASDGSFTPQELMAEAKRSGLSAVALTDHDILAGLFEAEAEAKRLNLIFVRGVEISIDWHPGEFHLLGLGLHKDSSVLDKLLENLQKERKNRNMRIIEKMRQAGFDIKPTQSAICAVMLYDAKLSQVFAQRMQEEGIYVTGFYYPVVPKEQARIRVQLSAGHEKEHLDKAIRAFIKVGKALNVVK